ncbi:GNAT family N-acetyltransferase [Rhodobacter sp. NSM]|uniref:GNAT family N-acetyltransferase n=1 Tax=Rhodobacter sp. NSM TaxID=3457501 RepID=UPI003FD497D2
MNVSRTSDLAVCRALRRVVFIEEQGVPEADEIDDLDDEAIHLLAMDEGRAVGTARLLLRGETGKIGRVCVLAECRGTGVGVALIRAAVSELRAVPGIRRAKLGSQSHATGFYEKLGFRRIGEEYLDAGIPHQDMVLEF